MGFKEENYQHLCTTLIEKCKNKNFDDCMCSNIMITRHSSLPRRIKIILIGQSLGY